LLGNLPVGLTEDLIDFGRRVGTYLGLAAGGKQLARLCEPRPHALLLNTMSERAAGRACGLGPHLAEPAQEVQAQVGVIDQRRPRGSAPAGRP
jgi:hypothetical protein